MTNDEVRPSNVNVTFTVLAFTLRGQRVFEVLSVTEANGCVF